MRTLGQSASWAPQRRHMVFQVLKRGSSLHIQPGISKKNIFKRTLSKWGVRLNPLNGHDTYLVEQVLRKKNNV